MIFKCLVFVIFIYKICCAPVTFEVADKTCRAPFNATADSPDLGYFMKYGKFPDGKENMKCFFECFFKALNAVDSRSVPTKIKLDEMIETERKSGSKVLHYLEFFATDIVVEKCLPPTDSSSPCNIAYSFMTCVIHVRDVLNLQNFDAVDFKSEDLKSIYSNNIKYIS